MQLLVLFFLHPVTQSAHATFVNSNWQKHIIAWQSTPIYLDVQDMDGDGDLDVVLAGMGGNKMIWYENKIDK